jgi:hypothetical protein
MGEKVIPASYRISGREMVQILGLFILVVALVSYIEKEYRKKALNIQE